MLAAVSMLLLMALIVPVLAQQEDGDIVSVLQADERFATLVQAVEAADLVETLQQEGPYTVFAPTDEAFDQLPDGALEDLLDDPQQLREVLWYHVVEGEVTAEDLSDGDTPATVQGENLDVSIDGEHVTINDASVVEADIEASNGVIHAIDGVLLPEAAAAEPEATPTGPPETLPETGGTGLPMFAALAMSGLVILVIGLSLRMVQRPR